MPDEVVDPCEDGDDAAALFGIAGDFAAARDSTHFRVMWDPATMESADAQALGDALEVGWTGIVDGLGWATPLGADEVLLPVVMGDFDGATASGLVACEGAGATAILAFDPSIVRGVYLGEFAAMQVARVSQYGAVGGMPSGDWSAWAAATSVWAADQAVPGLEACAGWAPSYADRPDLALGTENGEIEYGHCLWAAWLDEHVGGPELVRDTWTRLDGTALDAIDAALVAYDGDGLAARFPDFLAHASRWDFADGAAMEEALAERYEGLDAIEAYDIPAAGTFPELPERWGAGYATVASGFSAPSTVRVRVEGDPAGGWVLAATAWGLDGYVSDSVEADANGVAELDLSVSALDTVWLGAGATGDAAGGELTWTVESAAGEGGCACDGAARPVRAAAIALSILAARAFVRRRR
jgi:hypothetical protein